MIILDGKKAAKLIANNLKKEIKYLKKIPVFTIIQVGNLFSSNKYIKNKIDKAQELGIISRLIKVPESILEQKLINILQKEAKHSDGIIVQLPLPKHINKNNVLNAVPISKDIDGLSENNSKLLYSKQKCIKPATARGIIELIKIYDIKIENKNVVVIGESNLVGKPTKELFVQEKANVVSFNIKTGIKGSEKADILIVAVGSPKFIKEENVKKDVVIIDVGINSIGDDNDIKIIGDVDFESVKSKVKAISPVPGGVGPMTVISLFKNLIDIIKNSE